MLIKCKWCGKEFEKRDTQKFCCGDCALAYNQIIQNTKSKIKTIAKKYDFEIENMDKIVNAKMMLFKNDNTMRCPCAAQDPDHYCGSSRCIADTVYLGHCCCQLFWSKKEPLINNYIEKQKD